MNTDGHVRLLPIVVANKIAAGEVVERPASVLKELVENAIDAGASRIEVQVYSGGRKIVSVRDNGCGMTREDALLSLERQATSKIRDVDDIERIDTLGFRGEAIPSIASVSRFTLITRRADDDEATKLVVNAGILSEITSCGSPSGTTVEVRDLFCNVPARRKFLRSCATEETHIKNVFTVNALAHPDIGFSLSIDGREVYNFAPGANLSERIHDIFGVDFVDRLIPFESSEELPVKVHGMIEKPNSCEMARHDQFIFVNGRPASDTSIAYAVKDAYPRLQDNSRPALILFVDIDPTQVDVNVHPAKREVRFRRPRDVKESVYSAIRSAICGDKFICQNESVFAANEESLTPSFFVAPFSSAQVNLPDGKDDCFVSGQIEEEKIETQKIEPIITDVSTGENETRNIIEKDSEISSVTGPWKWFVFLAQAENGFVLLETDSGLVTLNPRAALERVVYEKLLKEEKTISQQLLIPETVQLSPHESSRIKGFKGELEKMGFQIEEFGKDTWKIDAIPAILSDVSVSSVLSSIATDISELGTRRGGNLWKEELTAKCIAKSCAGEMPKLSSQDAVKLVNSLAECRMPYVDPRGKVTMIFTSTRELKRKFNIL